MTAPAVGGTGAPPRIQGPLPGNGRWALRVTVVLIGVYIVLDLVAQLLPPHYSAITQAESDLAVGPYGFVMTANFVVRGILSLSFLAGLALVTTLRRRSPFGLALVGVWAVGAFVLAASPTDIGAETTVHGMVHLATAAIAFLAAAVGELLLALHFRDEPRLAEFATPALVVSVLGVLALVAEFAVIARPRAASEVFGLVERIFIGFVLLWMLLVSLHLLRGDRPGTKLPAEP